MLLAALASTRTGAAMSRTSSVARLRASMRAGDLMRPPTEVEYGRVDKRPGGAVRPKPNPLRNSRLLSPRSDTSEGTNSAVGYAVTRRLSVEVDEEKAMALGLQWLNTPRRWRRAVVIWRGFFPSWRR